MSELKAVLKEINEGLKKANRKEGSAKLIVASKYFSPDQILKLYDEGQRDFGENRVQDALEKIEKLPKDIHWHFIGHLQKNKVNKILGKFDLIHSVDSLELAEKISQATKNPQRILLQVNTSLEKSKEGMTKKECLEKISQIENLKNIVVEGLMTMAPFTDDKELVHKTFKALFEIKNQLKKEHWKLSMGMSQDFQIALQEGANYVRIGRRLLT